MKDVCFASYRVRPDWRLRAASQRATDRDVARLVDELGEREGVLIRPYSLVRTRGDADFMLWMVSERIDDLHFVYPFVKTRSWYPCGRSPVSRWTSTRCRRPWAEPDPR